MADSPRAQELQWQIPPIYWDPIPDWWLQRARPDVIAELLNTRFEVQREILQVQMNALERAQSLIQQGLMGTE